MTTSATTKQSVRDDSNNPDLQQGGTSSTIKTTLSLLLLLLFILLTPALISRNLTTVQFDDSHKKILSKNNPDYIFIGNSILYTRIDNELFNKALGKKMAGYQLALGGAGPTQWYLWFKNSVIGSGVRPKAVFLYFIRNELTTLEANLNQPDKRLLLEKSSVGEELVLKQIIAKNSTLKERFHKTLLKLYPIQLRQPEFNWIIDSLALLPTIPIYLQLQIDKIISPQNVSKEDIQASLHARQKLKQQIKNQLFTTSQWRVRYPDEWTVQENKTTQQQTFAQQLQNSLLPEILKLAKKHQINLVFIKAKLKPNHEGTREMTADAAQYATDLNRYITEQGFALHDFSQDKKIHHYHYVDESHIASKYKDFYINNFITTLPQYFTQNQ